MISQEAVDKFKRIYKNEFGEELSDATALELATNFLNLMREIVQPIPEEAKGHGTHR